MPARGSKLAVALVALAAVGAYAAFRYLGARHGVGTAGPVAPGVAVDSGEERWLKGQLHVHSSNSGDSHTPPEAVARWYAKRGYDFIVFTDHNYVTTLPPVDGMLVIPGVELTQNLETCEPPPEPGLQCLLHVNALFVDPSKPAAIGRAASLKREDLYARAIDVTLAMGGIAQVNHPNLHWGAGVPELVAAAKRGALLVEVANEAVDSNNEGDATHPSTTALWHAARDAGVRLFAVATDDAHHYEDAAERAARGEQVFTGDRGWIRVRARKDAQSIREAIERGDFYSETARAGPLTPLPTR